MKRVCLDTDFLVALLRNYPDAVTKAGEYDSTEIDVATTTMNAFELYLGAFRSDKAAQNVTEAETLLKALHLLDFTVECSRRAGELLSELFQTGSRIDIRDAIIAGIALVRGYTLVTRNERHFRRIPGLSLELW